MAKATDRLTDALRAEVFVRDKAICAFSGISLWLLDHGATPTFQMDWPDHVKPASRGGSSLPDNLVCASYSYNSKKRNNSADNTYLFRNGKPTYFYWHNFGEVTAAQARFMARNFLPADWYFNRALANILVALNNRYWHRKRSRGTGYWLKAAAKKLAVYRKLAADCPSMASRGLLSNPLTADTRLMLSLRDATTYREISYIAAKLYPLFVSQSDIFYRFIEAKSPATRKAAVSSARRASMNGAMKLKMTTSERALRSLGDALSDRE